MCSQIKALVAAATSAAETFEAYARIHADKGTVEGRRKANANTEEAHLLRNAIAFVEDSPEFKIRDGTAKTLNTSTINQAKDNISDLEVFGNGDTWRLLCKASSASEGCMKSTKVLPIPGLGCLVQVTTQQHDNIAEAVTFVPGAVLLENGADRVLAKEQPTAKEHTGPLGSYIGPVDAINR